jgi:hypothetical protein
MEREIQSIAIASARGFMALRAATFSTPAFVTAKREFERLGAQAAAARYAQEIASRNAKDSRRYSGAIDLPLFADV